MAFVGATNYEGDSKELLGKYDQVVALRDGYDAADLREALRWAGIDYQTPQIMRVHNNFHVAG